MPRAVRVLNFVILSLFQCAAVYAADAIAFNNLNYWKQPQGREQEMIYKPRPAFNHMGAQQIKIYEVTQKLDQYLIQKQTEFNKNKKTNQASSMRYFKGSNESYSLFETARQDGNKIHYTLIKITNLNTKLNIFEYTHSYELKNAVDDKTLGKQIEFKRNQLWPFIYGFSLETYKSRNLSVRRSPGGQAVFIEVQLPPFFMTGKNTNEKISIQTDSPLDEEMRKINKSNALAFAGKINFKQNIEPYSVLAYAVLLYNYGHRAEALYWYFYADSLYRIYEGAVYTNRAAFKNVSRSFLELQKGVTDVFENYGLCNVTKYIETKEKAILNSLETLPPIVENYYAKRHPGPKLIQKKNSLKNGAIKYIQRAKADLFSAKKQAELKSLRTKNKIDSAYCF